MSTFASSMEKNRTTQLIVDSGSTKTDWALVGSDGTLLATFQTEGINPVHQSDDAIMCVLNKAKNLCPSAGSTVECVNFYGAGLIEPKRPLMARLLSEAFSEPRSIEAENDLLGAARALCGHDEGIAAILGTGANSCLYDGQHIVENTPPLGYILGDEGSGAVLGRLFLNALFKGALPQEMRNDYLASAGMTYADIIQRVYREPQANRFLASTSLYICAHVSESEALQALVTDNFRQFFRRNIVPYGRRDLPLNAIGSIAHHYEPYLRRAAEQEGFCVGTVSRSPMEGLLAYHAR